MGQGNRRKNLHDKDTRKKRNKQQARLDLLTDGQKPLQLGPGEMRMDHADGSDTRTPEETLDWGDNSEVKAAAATQAGRCDSQVPLGVSAKKRKKKRVRSAAVQSAVEQAPALEATADAVPDLAEEAQEAQPAAEAQQPAQAVAQPSVEIQRSIQQVQEQVQQISNTLQAMGVAHSATTDDVRAALAQMRKEFAAKPEAPAARQVQAVAPPVGYLFVCLTDWSSQTKYLQQRSLAAAQPAALAECAGPSSRVDNPTPAQPAVERTDSVDLDSVDVAEQDMLLKRFAYEQAKRKASEAKKKAAAKKKYRRCRSSSTSSSSSSESDTDSSDDSWSTVDRSRGKKRRVSCAASSSSSEPPCVNSLSLRKKRALNKLAMEVVDHLPCKFVDWKKGPAKWLLTVGSAAHAVELPFEFLINKLGKAIGAESSKMAEWIADHTAEGGALSCSWSDYKAAFIQYFPAMPISVNRDTWAALSMDNCGGFHKYVQVFQRQSAEVNPSEAEKIHHFKRGLTAPLQNAVLLEPATREPWTEFAPLLHVATCFANALLGHKSTEKSKRNGADHAGKGKSSKTHRSDRKRSATKGETPSHQANPNKLRTKWCREQKRCDKCFQDGHFRADCPDTATEAERASALEAFAAWQKQYAKGKRPMSKKHFRK